MAEDELLKNFRGSAHVENGRPDKWISKGFMKLPKEEVENLYKEARAKGWIK